MPEYRYWGSLDPRGRVKPQIVAFVPTPEDDGTGEAVLRLYDPIDSWGGDWGVSAAEVAQALAAVPADRPIRLHVNSPGGEVYDAIAILNLLRAHRGGVTAVVDGIAASAASFIAAGVDRLVMQPNSELMIHDARGVGIGPADTMRRLAQDLDRVSDNIASIYAAKAGTPAAEWRARMLDETWLGADAAVEAGLADEVGTGLPVAEDPAAQSVANAAATYRTALATRARPASGSAHADGTPVEVERVVDEQVAPVVDEPVNDRAARFWTRRHEQNARRAS